MYVELGTTSKTILADLVQTLCIDNVWKLEYPVENIFNENSYSKIIDESFAVISTEYKINFNNKTIPIKNEDISNDNNFLIIQLKDYTSDFLQLLYNNTPLYETDSIDKIQLLEYYIENNNIYLLKNQFEKDKFSIMYSQSTDKTSKFYVKLAYPKTIITNNNIYKDKSSSLFNKYFIRWEFGKFIDENYQVYSDPIYKIPSKDFFCFWEAFPNNKQESKEILSQELFLNLNIIYDDKFFAFVVQNYDSKKPIGSFNYIGALEHSKNNLINDADNFCSAGTMLLSEQNPFSITGYYENLNDEDNILLSNYKHFTQPAFILYRTPFGAFYQPSKLAQYSLYEFDKNRYNKITHISSYTNYQMTSKVKVIHAYELGQGYLKNILTTPNSNLNKTILEVNYNGINSNFIYIKKGNIQDMFDNSDTIMNTILLQITN